MIFATRVLQCWDISQKGERDFGASFMTTTVLLLWKMVFFARRRPRQNVLVLRRCVSQVTTPHKQTHLGEGCVQCNTNRRPLVPGSSWYMTINNLPPPRLPMCQHLLRAAWLLLPVTFSGLPFSRQEC